MAAPKRGRASLALVHFSDIEMLSLVVDAADGDGWASAKDIAQLPAMGWLRKAHDRPHVAVAIRLSWLWRYGVLDREHLADEHGNLRFIAGDPHRPKWGQRWQLNEAGEALVYGRLSARQLEQLHRIGRDSGQLLEVTRWLTERTRGDGVTGRMLAREWRYGTAKERIA